MPEYSHPRGPLNLVSYLEDNSVKPDLGPKSYVAFGRCPAPPSLFVWAGHIDQGAPRLKHGFSTGTSSIQKSGLWLACLMMRHGSQTRSTIKQALPHITVYTKVS